MQLVIRHGANPNLVDERGEVAFGGSGSLDVLFGFRLKGKFL